jgi:hypothetical protein
MKVFYRWSVIFFCVMICLTLSCQKKESEAVAETEVKAETPKPETDSTKSDFKNVLGEIFGIHEKIDDSGVEVDSVLHAGFACSFDYYFNAPSLENMKAKVGLELTPKIKTLFEKETVLTSMRLSIYVPQRDMDGNITNWSSGLGFTFTRDIYDQINRDDYEDNTLLDVVDDLSWHNKELEGK